MARQRVCDVQENCDGAIVEHGGDGDEVGMYSIHGTTSQMFADGDVCVDCLPDHIEEALNTEGLEPEGED